MAKSFVQNLRANFFFELLRMKRNEFCAVLRYFFAQFAQNRKYFFRKLRMNRNFSFAQNRKFYAKCNFLGKLSTIDILSLEFKNLKIYFKHKKKHTSMITIILHSIGYFQLQKVKIKGPKLIK